MTGITKSTDWKIEQLPEVMKRLDYQRTFSAEEFEWIRRGLAPQVMEDKWFIYYENDLLCFHRSWTGHFIYRLTVRPAENNTYVVGTTLVNRTKGQYDNENDEYDALFLNYLIDRLLLAKDVAFPIPSNIGDNDPAVFKHSMVGNATPGAAGRETEKVLEVDRKDRLKGCLVGGAIGDAVGSQYEWKRNVSFIDFDIPAGITDDTQLTLATCESILECKRVSPEHIAGKFLEWYNARRLSGLGASTLKALRDLQAGAHWGLSGRSGEYAAGNGAAMRIAPLAFFTNVADEKPLIRDVCNITHKNDEAYMGCLAILCALTFAMGDLSDNEINLPALICPLLPDTGVRDNLLKLQENPALRIRDAARLIGCSGYVIESVPFSIFAAQKIVKQDFKDILSEIISCGGDTDTNASLAGQIMGAFLGYTGLPENMQASFHNIRERDYILRVADQLGELLHS